MSGRPEARSTPTVEDLRAAAFRIPTDAPESDGTLEWSATTLIVVEVDAAGQRGLGYTYASEAVLPLLHGPLRETVLGADVFSVERVWLDLFGRVRNLGQSGLTACAVSALDCALWDLKARLLDVSLLDLFGAAHATLPLYGSGGFTSYSDAQLTAQFEEWAALGMRQFKMKIGRQADRDLGRCRTARAAIGDEAELFVDGNGAYFPKQAIAVAQELSEAVDIRWFEQPLPPEDYSGLHLVREHLPPRVELATGEYGYGTTHYRLLLESDAVDVVMIDVTRCGGYTGWRKIAALAEAWHLPVSSHCAPALHLPIGCATRGMRHAEYFHDHARIERLLLEGNPAVVAGAFRPDRSQPGLGLTFKWRDAERFAVTPAA